MAPSLLFDISQIDLASVQIDAQGIEKINPHRGLMRQLDGIIWLDLELHRALAYKDIAADEFWVPGHIPGRPLMPGVMMIEAAAQLASYVTMRHFEGLEFVGFVGCDDVKFRGQVVPGDRMLFLGAGISMKRRRCVCLVQGLLRGTLVFEAKITGMPM